MAERSRLGTILFQVPLFLKFFLFLLCFCPTTLAFLFVQAPRRFELERSCCFACVISVPLLVVAFRFLLNCFGVWFFQASSYTHPKQWDDLREDLLDCQERLFPFIPLENVNVQLFEIAFACNAFDFIEACIELDPRPISFDNLYTIAIRHGRELINVSLGHDSQSLDEAESCLNLIPKSHRVKEYFIENDLVHAIKLLNSRFDFTIIPLQLRKIFYGDNNNCHEGNTSTTNNQTKGNITTDTTSNRNNNEDDYLRGKKFEFFKDVLIADFSTNYQYKDDLLKIADWLSCRKNNHKIELLILCAQCALSFMQQLIEKQKSENEDSDENVKEDIIECQKYAYSVYQDIFDNYYKYNREYPEFIMSPLWNICSNLVKLSCETGIETPDFINDTKGKKVTPFGAQHEGLSLVDKLQLV